MTLISGLNNNDAVLLDGAFYVQLPAGTYEIAGKTTTIPYSGRQFVVESIDNIYHLVKDPVVLTGFVDEDGNEFGNLAHWRNLKALNSEYLENGYPSLEEEFTLRSELAKYNGKKMVYTDPEPRHVNVKFNVIGSMIGTGSKFIQSALTFGAASFQGRGMYQVDRLAISLDEFDKLKNEYPKLKRDSGYLQFAKHGGDYLFTRENENAHPYLKGASSVICTSLEQARAVEETVRKFVRQVVLMTAVPKALTDVSTVTLSSVIDKLKNAMKNLNSTQAMKASRNDLSAGRQRVNEAIAMLTDAIED